MPISGGCLCGKLRYSIKGPLIEADHCHCSMCRRQHGAAFASYADFKPGDFSWTAGENLLRIFEVPGGGGWCFCTNCGSTLAGSEHGKITSVTLGTIEGDPGIKPGSHIFTGSRASWYAIRDKLPQFAERANKDSG